MKKAEITRVNILQRAFELIYVQGYQKTSVDDILATTQVTKGAFYYHFKNKDEMGLAIIQDILKPNFINSFIEPLEREEDPINAIYAMMHSLLLKNKFMSVAHGCPASNLTQEMTPWNSDFTEALETLIHQLERKMVAVFEKGKKTGFIRKDVHSKQATLFIFSGYWGIRNFGKLANSKSIYQTYLKELKNYLNSLK